MQDGLPDKAAPIVHQATSKYYHFYHWREHLFRHQKERLVESSGLSLGQQVNMQGNKNSIAWSQLRSVFHMERLDTLLGSWLFLMSWQALQLRIHTRSDSSSRSLVS